MYYIFATRRHCSSCDLEYQTFETDDYDDAAATARQLNKEGYEVKMIRGRKVELDEWLL